MKALFILRAQPFHKGHLRIINEMINDETIDIYYITIGSSQYSYCKDNPFTIEERTKMVYLGIDNFHKFGGIIAIPDMHDPFEWANHVNRITRMDIVYTGSAEICRVLEKSYQIKLFQRINDYSGTTIREKMKSERPEIITTWADDVPDKVGSYIYKINGIERIQNISK